MGHLPLLYPYSQQEAGLEIEQLKFEWVLIREASIAEGSVIPYATILAPINWNFECEMYIYA